MIMKVPGIGLLSCTLFFFLAGTTALAKGNYETCTGNYTGTLLGNLVVPAGHTCQLDQFNVVDGNIRVERGANLIVCPDNEIRGNILAHQPESIYLSDLMGGPCSGAKALGIVVEGDIKIQGGTSVTLVGNPYGGIAVLQGNVHVEHVDTVSLRSFSNLSSMEGDVLLEHNGTVSVIDNVLAGDLKIHGTVGTCTEDNNTVEGQKNSCP